VSSSDDDVEDNELDKSSSDSCDDLSDIRPIDDSEDDVDAHIRHENLRPGDYVIVKIKGVKNSHSHYIARIDKPVSDELEIDVTYLQKLRAKLGDDGPERFIDNVKEIYAIPLEDVVKKLPPPLITGGTKRVSRQIVFPIDLSDFKLGQPIV